ncbi:unnamed protein product [Thelazia callipaeda]|uniref:Uncharacterized protein n=1 Tax=Thelazia callipaeda TaxID=103827 RepID=A0A0N5D9W6_THECL|nr:unnamed protein product [Thelazia callipaeda]
MSINQDAGTRFRNVHTECGRVGGTESCIQISVLSSLPMLIMRGADESVGMSSHPMVHVTQPSTEFAQFLLHLFDSSGHRVFKEDINIYDSTKRENYKDEIDFKKSCHSIRGILCFDDLQRICIVFSNAFI